MKIRMQKNIKKFKFSKYKVLRNFIILSIIVLFFSLKSHAYNNSISYKTIIVNRGQTLWNIAKEEQKSNEYFKNKDIRDIIKNIEKTNNIKNSTIYENQKLKIIEL
ncbi:MAG: LysM peptidoglycan-binding domain-containing protein [Clostridia bacterium]|nr:LysM peptidoglycan-binding domain-containing protein [Clostridia bacterium]